MSKIHYFQRYSQRENVITNNTLLLFSRLYQYNPSLLEELLNTLLGEDVKNIVVGIAMEQQKASKESTPDGFIGQESFKIVIETKRHSDFHSRQIEGHLGSFEEESRQILILLSPEHVTNSLKEELKRVIKSKNKTIQLVATTFENIIKYFREVIDEHRDFEMLDLIEDYEDYCTSENILPLSKYTMRVLTAGYSIETNREFNVYYDIKTRGYRGHKYLGLYKNKSVRSIGEIENIFLANLENGELTHLESKLRNRPITEDQKQRIKDIIEAAWERHSDKVHQNHQFFLVKKFHDTDFDKKSKYPIQRAKYFNLKDELEVDELPATEQIAQDLKQKSWE